MPDVSGVKMNIENLKTFRSIAHNKSFTKAAEECFCTQSTASLRIQNLEDYFGIKVFDRIGKKVHLTTAGKVLLPYIELILSTYEEAEDRITQLKKLSFGRISIISSHTPGTYILPEIIHKFHKRYPSIKINSHIQYSKNLIHNLLSNNQYDLGLISQPQKIEDDKLICEPLIQDQLVVVTNSSHPWGKRGVISIEEIAEETLLLSNRSTTLISYINSISNIGLKLEQQIVIGNIESVKRAVISGLGVSILSSFAVKDELASGMLKEIKIENTKINRTIYLLRRKNKIPSPAISAFIALLLNEVKHDRNL